MKRLHEVLQKKVAAMVFGRFNPPTQNHQKMLEKLMAEAKNVGAVPHVFVSQVKDTEDNALSTKNRVKYLRLAMPNLAENVICNSNIMSVSDAIDHLVSEEYTDILMVVGEDLDESYKDSIVTFKKKIKNLLNGPSGLDQFEKAVLIEFTRPLNSTNTALTGVI